MIGRLIGKGGETVMRLQDDTGAKIDVSKDDLHPEVRLSGSISSVERACDLISAMISERPPSEQDVSSWRRDSDLAVAEDVERRTIDFSRAHCLDDAATTCLMSAFKERARIGCDLSRDFRELGVHLDASKNPSA